MQTGRILVASNGEQARKELRAALELEGHEVVEAETAEQTIKRSMQGRLDAVILDAALDQAEPYGVCRAVRRSSEVGIILICSDDSGQSRIDALNSGADDLLPGGFVWAELLARVRALVRRVRIMANNGEQIVLPDRAIDFRSHEITGPGGRIARLTPKECLLLRHLVTHADRPLAPQTLARSLWQRDGQGRVEFVRNVVQQLRGKLEPDPSNPRYILTHRSLGYQFQMPAQVHLA